MPIEVVLVEYESHKDHDIFTSSGLRFSEKFVLITGHVLLSFLKQFKLDEWFSNHNTGEIHYDIFEPSITPKLNVVIKKHNYVTSKPAKVIAGFICQNIMKSCKKHLKDWAIEFDDKTYQSKEFLSLFFILEIQTGSYQDSSKHIKWEVNKDLLHLLQSSGGYVPSIGHEIFIESVPFGNRTFFNSYSQGIVSNVVGENSCFLLTDSPSTPGSEGSPVFVKAACGRSVVAIVISCVNWWKGEWVGLTLTASLDPLFLQFSDGFGRQGVSKNCLFASSKLLGVASSSLVQVTSRSLWGTAILIDKQKGIFLTNSHVVESNQIVLYWQGHQIKASLIYKTPNADVYDVAILQCNSSLIRHLSILEAQISLSPLEVGEDIFAAGYPLFQYQLEPFPTVTKGNISQVHTGMLKSTCCVLPGASGGAIFRTNGDLIGIIVSNIKINESGIVYPRVNMAIPMSAIYYIIEDFLTTGGTEYLHKLHSKDSRIIREWNYLCREDIFAAGYPLCQYQLEPLPTVTKGNISQVHAGMLKTTCCVLPGASGGAIFRTNGDLIGIIVSNIKINESDIVYPRVNMAIPMSAIYYIIEDLLTTGGTEYLHKLHSKDSRIIREWNYLCSKL